jgi:hypothetical protein
MPTFAKAMAMPLPIVPKPTIPTERIGRTTASEGRPAIFCASRSAKRTWRSARASGPSPDTSMAQSSHERKVFAEEHRVDAWSGRAPPR